MSDPGGPPGGTPGGTPGGAPAAPEGPRYAVRRVEEGDVHAVHMLLAVCGRHLATAHGFDNWRRPYPLERLRADVREREVYAVREGETLVATFTVGLEPVHPYDAAIWAEPEARAMYLNRLAVAPAAQGQGIGTRCMTYVERLAARAGCAAVRLDALAANRRLVDWYAARGYVARGRRAREGYEFVCLERTLGDAP